MGSDAAIRARLEARPQVRVDRPLRTHKAGRPRGVVSHGPLEQHVTLLELVEAVGSVTDDDVEVVATVVYMLRSGTVKLCGSFRGLPPTCWATGPR